MTKDEFYQKWNPGGTFNNPHSEHDKDILDNTSTHKEFMADLNGVILKAVNKKCKYPECYYYDPKSKVYCCNACAGDHYDHDRLHKGKKEGLAT
jgi:hypothetical protein